MNTVKIMVLPLISLCLLSCGKQDSTTPCYSAEQMVYKCVANEINKNNSTSQLPYQVQQCEQRFHFGSCFHNDELN